MTNPTERFVSLHGFYAFRYPSHWKNEVDEAGHYLFYDINGGYGVLRMMMLKNEFEGDDAEKNMFNEMYEQNKDFNPSLYAAGQNRFIHFVKEHDLSGTLFTVYYWATVFKEQVLLFAYTIQSAMKSLPVCEQEREQIENLISTLEWMHDTAHHG